MPGVKSWKPMVKCKCPKCRKKYKKEMYWTGRGRPWKLCEECKKFSESIEHLEEYTAHVDWEVLV